MGTALLNLTKQQKLGGRGAGCLTKDKVLYFQRMYRRAIVNNTGDVDSMRSAIWAALFHCMSTDEPHHTRCPPGEGSWCFFRQAEAVGEEPGPHKDNVHHPLEYSVAEAMIPMYNHVGPQPRAPGGRPPCQAASQPRCSKFFLFYIVCQMSIS